MCGLQVSSECPWNPEVVVAGSTSFLEGTADPSILIEEEGRSLRLQRPETGAKPFYPAVRTKFPLKKGDVHWSSPARVERNPGRRSWNWNFRGICLCKFKLPESTQGVTFMMLLYVTVTASPLRLVTQLFVPQWGRSLGLLE